MKLAVWAKKQGVAYLTAYRWFRNGTLPVRATQTLTGTILIEENPIPTDNHDAWVYARVSSNDKRGDLDRQAERCIDFCKARGWVVRQVIKEIGSGMNDSRPKLTKLLEGNPTRIVVEHKDRLTRFGFHYFEVLLPRIHCELIVMDRDTEAKDDLMKDLMAVITSFCCRIYGLRRGRNKAKIVKGALAE